MSRPELGACPSDRERNRQTDREKQREKPESEGERKEREGRGKERERNAAVRDVRGRTQGMTSAIKERGEGEKQAVLASLANCLATALDQHTMTGKDA